MVRSRTFQLKAVKSTLMLLALALTATLSRLPSGFASASPARQCQSETCAASEETLANKQKIRVEMVADVVCPYCYIGLHRLQKAIRMSNQIGLPVDIEVVYSPFILRRQLSKTGVEKMEVFRRQFGSEEQALRVFDGVKQNAASDGLCFNMQGQRAGNSEDAHRLLLWARTHGKELELFQRLMQAYNCEQGWLGDHDVLAKCAVDVGLADRDARQVLADRTTHLEELDQLISHAQQLGVSGVPFFVVGGQKAGSGAVASDDFLRMFKALAGNAV